MLNIHNLSVSFGGTYLFEEVTFRLGAGDRVGLVGKNGAGKSTMLKILARDFAPDSGVISQEKEVKLGFLRQDIDFEHGRTVLEEAYEAFTEIKIVEKKLEQINHLLVTRTDYESEEYSQIIEDLSDYTHRFELLGGYNYVGDTEKILLGLGFKREDFNNQTETFSGGWRMRIELAKLLLQSNDVLLLDEPTNHLDIESIIWLESFLRNYPGVVVIVSHDKMFLDNVTNRTIEISLGKAYDFNKPYSEYLELRHEIREKQLATQKNQAKKIEETEKLIEKFRAKASKASMAQCSSTVFSDVPPKPTNLIPDALMSMPSMLSGCFRKKAPISITHCPKVVSFFALTSIQKCYQYYQQTQAARRAEAPTWRSRPKIQYALPSGTALLLFHRPWRAHAPASLLANALWKSPCHNR
jgi:ATP-binding cassette subfamily F protein 3